MSCCLAKNNLLFSKIAQNNYLFVYCNGRAGVITAPYVEF